MQRGTVPGRRSGPGTAVQDTSRMASVGQPRFAPFKVQAASTETLNAHTKTLSNGAVGINFHELAAPNLAQSAVLRMLEEEEKVGGIKRVAWPPPQEQTVFAAAIEQTQALPKLQGDLEAHPPATLLYSPPPPEAAMEANTCVFTIPTAVSSTPPPATIPLRPAPPVTQPPAPVVRSEPALPAVARMAASASPPAQGSGLRGDTKWPPSSWKQLKEAERQQQAEIARGPAVRPRRPQKDYSAFFEQNRLQPTYSHYRAPPGTQHYPV